MPVTMSCVAICSVPILATNVGDSRVFVAADGSLHIVDIEMQSTGSAFTCRAINSVGAATRSFELAVHSMSPVHCLFGLTSVSTTCGSMDAAAARESS